MGNLSAESAASDRELARLDVEADERLTPADGVTDRDQAALLRRISHGDQAAMAEFYRLHSRAVLTHISLIVGERALAEEIFQDTMLAIWRSAGSFRGESRVRTWVVAIARRQARDRLRRRQLQVVSDTELIDQPCAGPGPEAVALKRAAVTEVAEAIAKLGRSHREVLGLVFAADLSLAEAATVLGVPVGTVKSRLAAARSALVRVLNDEGERR